MNELLIHLAAALPEDMLVDVLIEQLNKYISTKNVDDLRMAKMSMTILISKDTINDVGSTDELIKKMNLMKKGYDLLNTTKG